MNNKVLITLFALIFISIGSWMAIRFAKGYRPDLSTRTIAPTGLLVANSFPNGASVYLNDKLTTATDNTLHLPPGEYQTKIIKDGYIEWKKTLQIKQELVTQTSAELFKSAPDLQSLTSTGAINPLPSPDGLKIAYVVASASASKNNGLWVLDMQAKTFNFSSNLKQVGVNSREYDFTKAGLFWTPDSSQILCVFENGDNVLLDTERLTGVDEYIDVTARLPILINEWTDELNIKEEERIAKLPAEMQKIASESAGIKYFSPDEEKLLYLADKDAQIKNNLIPPVPASSTQTEERNIKAGNIYIYDILEDKNFFIKTAEIIHPDDNLNFTLLAEELIAIQKRYSPLFFANVQWHPSSRHLIWLETGKINIVEYDGQNKMAVYNGPFNNGFVFPWTDGNRLLVLTNLNQDVPDVSNLYGVGIK